MPRVQDTEEVRILRFFEDEPLQKAELLFRIVADKMRRRMPPGRPSPKKKDDRTPHAGSAKSGESVANP